MEENARPTVEARVIEQQAQQIAQLQYSNTVLSVHLGDSQEDAEAARQEAELQRERANTLEGQITALRAAAAAKDAAAAEAPETPAGEPENVPEADEDATGTE